MTLRVIASGPRPSARRGIVALWVFASIFSGCSDKHSSPVAPEPPVTTTTVTADSTRWSISGTVSNAPEQAPVANAKVETLDGPSAGQSTVTDAQGHYALSGLQPGTVSVRASLSGFEAASHSISLTANQTVDFALRPASADPAPARWVLAGTIRDAGTLNGLAAVRLEVLDGKNQGQSTVTDPAGHYSFAPMEQDGFSVRVTADQFVSETRTVTLSSALTMDLSLRPVAPAGPVTTGRVVNGVSDQALSGVLVHIDGAGDTTTGPDGSFSMAASGPTQVRSATLTSSTTIDRITRLRVPGSAATITLMPKSLDLPSFDQMFRGDGGVLHRWTVAPRVVVQRRSLKFTNRTDTQFTATSVVMSDAEVADLMADLRTALAQLTGSTFATFAEERVETATEDEVVNVTRPGWIVVARYDGLTTATTFWGYTKWAWNGAGEMQAASLMLDRAFEASVSPYHRSLHSHELAHALGCNHVTGRQSVMNISARLDITAWDRDAARMAFLRPPLNQTPDIDPDPYTINTLRTHQLFWSGAE
ncbi:MAG: carboxypeptidase regulatory-like domain-containing protein [Vicinamibacterales bacterium]